MIKLKEPQKANSLFENWQETIIWSCLQGVMGNIYADDRENPKSAMAVLGDFCFLAGEPCEELLEEERRLAKGSFRILVPQDERWAKQIVRYHGNRAKEGIRYAFKKEPGVFEREMLKETTEKLPEGYVLRRIDEEIYRQCRAKDWSRDLVSQYTDYGTYKKLALGVAVLKGGRVAAGASAYSRYEGGIEIEIDTQKEHRRQGLAGACGAALILECLEQGLYPSWDAQNPVSAALAQKLGYHFSHTYIIYEIFGMEEKGHAGGR